MKVFNYCPFCKSSDISFIDGKEIRCNACSRIYFHNVAASGAAVLEYDHKILLIRRAMEPGKGKLDLPGGFIDPREALEDGLKREIREELGITVDKMEYLGSSPNMYKYRDVTYNTCDIFFHAKIESLPAEYDRTEISELVLINPSEISPEEIAFESTPKGIELFRKAKAQEQF